MKHDESWVVGGIFTLIVVLGMWLQSNHQLNKQLLLLQNNYLQAKHLVIQLDRENKLLELNLELAEKFNQNLKEQHKDLDKLIRIQEELKDYSTEEKAIALALAWTESTWKYQVLHPGNKAKGICGIVPTYWEDMLSEKDIPINSTAACIEIYSYYEDQTGSAYEAIKLYKGISKNKQLINKTLKIKNKIYQILKD